MFAAAHKYERQNVICCNPFLYDSSESFEFDQSADCSNFCRVVFVTFANCQLDWICQSLNHNNHKYGHLKIMHLTLTGRVLLTNNNWWAWDLLTTTAHSLKNQTRNRCRKESRDPEWSSKVSFQMAYLKRNLNLTIQDCKLHSGE